MSEFLTDEYDDEDGDDNGMEVITDWTSDEPGHGDGQ